MSKKTFNPADWTETNKTESKTTANNKPIPPLGGGQVGSSDIETITERIESSGADIAPNYADWRDLGFALADELGESGKILLSPTKSVLSGLQFNGSRQTI